MLNQVLGELVALNTSIVSVTRDACFPVSMPTGVEDTQVSNVKSATVGKDKLKISWDKPKTKAEILYYEISYKVERSDGMAEHLKKTVSSFRNFDISVVS